MMALFQGILVRIVPSSTRRLKADVEKQPSENFFHNKGNLYSHEHPYSPRPRGSKREHPFEGSKEIRPANTSTSALNDKEELGILQENRTPHVRPRPMRFAPSKEWNTNNTNQPSPTP